MSKNVKFYLDQTGVQKAIYKSSRLKDAERDVMERALSETRAAFLNEFGFQGEFILEYREAKVNSRYISGIRPTYRIKAGDARTGAVLKRNPGWLSRFSSGASF